MSQSERLRDLIAAALDGGMTYSSIAAKTTANPDASVSKSMVHKIATGQVKDGKVPLTALQLRALARAIGQPWEKVKAVVLAEAGLAEVAQFDGARIVVQRASEELTPEELDIWASMAEDLVRLVRDRRTGQ